MTITWKKGCLLLNMKNLSIYSERRLSGDLLFSIKQEVTFTVIHVFFYRTSPQG